VVGAAFNRDNQNLQPLFESLSSLHPSAFSPDCALNVRVILDDFCSDWPASQPLLSRQCSDLGCGLFMTTALLDADLCPEFRCHIYAHDLFARCWGPLTVTAGTEISIPDNVARDLWMHVAHHVAVTLQPVGPRPDGSTPGLALTSVDAVFNMFDISYSQAPPGTAHQQRQALLPTHIGFHRLTSATFRLPPNPPSAFSFPGWSIFSILFAGMPQLGPVSELREFLFGVAIARSLRTLDCSQCSASTQAFVRALRKILQAFPVSYHARFFRLLVRSGCFGELPSFLSAWSMPLPAQTVLAALFASPPDLSLCPPQRPATLLPLYASDIEVERRYELFRNEFRGSFALPFELMSLFRPHLEAAVVAFGSMHPSASPSAQHWDASYDAHGVFRK
jgi:hypothetical protein